jgi:hypothetical protein
MNELTNEKKIEVLERIVTAIFGRQEAKIKYVPNAPDLTQVELECDIDDAVKVLDNLRTAEIESDFYTGERPLSEEDVKFYEDMGIKDRKWEGITEITLYVETRYWKKAKELEEEIKKLKEQLKGQLKDQTSTLGDQTSTVDFKITGTNKAPNECNIFHSTLECNWKDGCLSCPRHKERFGY